MWNEDYAVCRDVVPYIDICDCWWSLGYKFDKTKTVTTTKRTTAYTGDTLGYAY